MKTKHDIKLTEAVNEHRELFIKLIMKEHKVCRIQALEFIEREKSKYVFISKLKRM